MVLSGFFFNGPKLVQNILQTIGIVVLLVELFFVITKKPSVLQRNLIVIIITGIFAFIAYSIELNAQTLEIALVGCKLGYATKPFTVLATFFLLADYTHIHIRKWGTIALYAYFICLSIFVFTCEYHNLYYSSINFNIQDIGSPMQVGHGPVWYVYMASTFALFGAYAFMVIREYRYSITSQAKKMCIYLFLMLFSGILGLLLFILGVTADYDTTLTGLLIGTIIMLVLLVRFNLFDSLSLAKDTSIDKSRDGLIVYDARNSLSFSNKVAKQLIEGLTDDCSRKVQGEVFKKVNSMEDGEFLYANQKIYKFSKKPLFTDGKRKRLIGTTYKFRDVTLEHEYQENLKKDVESATKKIKEMQRSILISISNIVEARDKCTGEHINNVANVATAIARQLVKEGKHVDVLNDDSIAMIGETAPLHDIGKIFIPDNILGKPGKLTAEEFEIMKTHSAKGEDLIEESVGKIEKREYVEAAKLIAGQHHERWDGTGYPNRLKGDEISLFARIVAVADVYDALRMKRPYKEAFSQEKSIEIIESEKGTHFDPEIVDAFLKIVK